MFFNVENLIVNSRELDEESGDDIIDTEDELEAIPEVTGDLEEELANTKPGFVIYSSIIFWNTT